MDNPETLATMGTDTGGIHIKQEAHHNTEN